MRSWTGAKAQKTSPAGTLKEWHWRALAKAYAADDEGLDDQPYGDYGRISWNTWLRLRDYKWGALIEERAYTTPQLMTRLLHPPGNPEAVAVLARLPSWNGSDRLG